MTWQRSSHSVRPATRVERPRFREASAPFPMRGRGACGPERQKGGDDLSSCGARLEESRALAFSGRLHTGEPGAAKGSFPPNGTELWRAREDRIGALLRAPDHCLCCVFSTSWSTFVRHCCVAVRVSRNRQWQVKLIAPRHLTFRKLAASTGHGGMSAFDPLRTIKDSVRHSPPWRIPSAGLETSGPSSPR